MIIRNEDERVEFNNVSAVQDLAIGYNEDSFAIAINKQADGSYEGVYVIKAERLQEIVAGLFEVGVACQRETGIDIGFGIGDDYEE